MKIHNVINILKYNKQDLLIKSIRPTIKNAKTEPFKTFSYAAPHTHRVTNNLKKQTQLNVAYNTNNKLSRLIRNHQNKTAIMKQCGVYKLNCLSCNSVYVGQTERLIFEII